MLPRGYFICLLLVATFVSRASNSEPENITVKDFVYKIPYPTSTEGSQMRFVNGTQDLLESQAYKALSTTQIILEDKTSNFGIRGKQSLSSKQDRKPSSHNTDLWEKFEKGQLLINEKSRFSSNILNRNEMKSDTKIFEAKDNNSLIEINNNDPRVAFLKRSDAWIGDDDNYVQTDSGPIAKKVLNRNIIVNSKVRKNPNTEISTIDPMTSVLMRFRREMGHTGTEACKKFEEVDLEKGIFYSPGYPGNYPNNTDCVVVLEAGPGQILKLDFRDTFDLEPSDGCNFDFLEIRDGAHGYSTLIDHYCGHKFPPIITSKGRHLWLHFRSDENIEYSGFTAVFEFMQRPATGLYDLDQTCIIHKDGEEGTVSRSDIDPELEKSVIKYSLPLDCMWVITVKPGWKINLVFDHFKLKKPNDCDSNFVDIFSDRTDLPSRLKNLCGSIAEAASSKNNLLYMRFLADPSAINSSFEALFTAYRDRAAGETCNEEEEYDCEDATCISKGLRCNGNYNCRFKWDEDECTNNNGSGIMQSEHIVIIMVIFSLILSGMSIAFLFKCIKKLIDDHKIIQENIRQSREADLDEIDKPFKMDRPKGGLRSARHSKSLSDESLQVAFDIPCHVPVEGIVTHLNEDHIDSRSSDGTGSVLLSAHKNNKRNELLARKQNNNIQMRDHSTETTDEIDAIIEEETQTPDTCDSACQTRESLFQTSPVHCQERSASYGWRNLFTPVSLPRGQSGSTVRHLTSPPSSGNSGKDCYKAEAIIEMESSDEKHNYEADLRTRRPSSVGTTRSAPDVIIVSAPPAR